MITAELQSRPFGIDIETSQTSGGIFVSMVEPGSVAAQSGVMVGDQLLDVRQIIIITSIIICCALTLLVGRKEGHLACKKLEWWGTGMVICLE